MKPSTTLHRTSLVRTSRVIALWAILAALAAAHGQQTSGARPILVELFTSEGCSSCPPADVLLANLERMQPVAGAQAIVLSEHVDYWDHDGWKDPYSSGAITERQDVYGRRFQLNSVYTPEMVVDGETQFSGSDAHAAVHALEAARNHPKVPIRVDLFAIDARGLHVRVDADPLPASAGVRKADVFLVVALDRAESQVLRGENKGRDLKHVAVALAITKVGSVEEIKAATGESGGFSREVVMKLPSQVDARNLRLIAFIQKSDEGQVLGATMIEVSSTAK